MKIDSPAGWVIVGVIVLALAAAAYFLVDVVFNFIECNSNPSCGL